MKTWTMIAAASAVVLLGGCMATTGASTQGASLNQQAFPLRGQYSGDAKLAEARTDLLACVTIAAYAAPRGQERAAVSQDCQTPELAYRAAIMANVRPDWRGRRHVLINTANTTTGKVIDEAIDAVKEIKQ